jgi:hypothetical protein
MKNLDFGDYIRQQGSERTIESCYKKLRILAKGGILNDEEIESLLSQTSDVIIHDLLRSDGLEMTFKTLFDAGGSFFHVSQIPPKKCVCFESLKPLLGPQFWSIYTQLALLGVHQNTN